MLTIDNTKNKTYYFIYIINYLFHIQTLIYHYIILKYTSYF